MSTVCYHVDGLNGVPWPLSHIRNRNGRSGDRRSDDCCNNLIICIPHLIRHRLRHHTREIRIRVKRHRPIRVNRVLTISSFQHRQRTIRWHLRGLHRLRLRVIHRTQLQRREHKRSISRRRERVISQRRNHLIHIKRTDRWGVIRRSRRRQHCWRIRRRIRLPHGISDLIRHRLSLTHKIRHRLELNLTTHNAVRTILSHHRGCAIQTRDRIQQLHRRPRNRHTSRRRVIRNNILSLRAVNETLRRVIHSNRSSRRLHRRRIRRSNATTQRISDLIRHRLSLTHKTSIRLELNLPTHNAVHTIISRHRRGHIIRAIKQLQC